MQDEEIEVEPYDNSDDEFDKMKDEFLMIENEKDALECIRYYGVRLSRKYLPGKYKSLLVVNNE